MLICMIGGERKVWLNSCNVKKVLESSISVQSLISQGLNLACVKKVIKSYDKSSYYQFEVQFCKHLAFSS